MLYSSVIGPAVLLSSVVTAFSSFRPSYVDEKKAFQVASQEVSLADYLTTNDESNKVLSSDSTSGGQTTISVPPSVVNLAPGMEFIYSDSNGDSYIVNATIGNGTYPLLIDTGSPYLWVYGSGCSDTSCSNKLLYHLRASSSSSANKFDLSYNGGQASGVVTEDSVTIAGRDANGFPIGVASSVPSMFQSYPFNGVLGLSTTDDAYSGGLTNIVSYLHNSSITKAATFALCMNTYNTSVSGAHNNSGILLIGADGKDLYTEPLYSTSAMSDSANHWEMKMNGVYVDGHQASFAAAKVGSTSSNHSRLALIDTGTTAALVLTKKDSITLHSYFPDSVSDGTNFAIFCNSTQVISLDIAGHNWTISPSQYVGSKYGDDSGLPGYCISKFQGLDSTEDGSWILGNTFLKNYYIEFNYDNSSIGLAERKPNVVIASSGDYGSSSNDTSSASSSNSSASSTHPTATVFGSSNNSSSSNSSHNSTSTGNANPFTTPSLGGLTAAMVLLLILI